MAKETTATTPTTTPTSKNNGDAKPTIVDVDRPRGGLVTTWMDLSLGMAEETVKTSFGILQEVRNETADRVSATLDFVEGINQGVIRMGRKINDRIDRVSNKAIDSGEKAALSLVTAFRRTGRGATELATTTTAALIAEDKPN
jgi:hypothetical protein